MNSCEKSKALADARGYIGQLQWLEKQSKRYDQKKCWRCGLYHLWKRKRLAKESEE